ncbi:alcohol dehydrogenase catalytic domain-containing protein [Geodermatophilus sp. URMC 63]
MRAWRVHELGDPSEVVRPEDVEEPTPGEGQIEVRVRAAALNFPDVLMAQGRYQERPPLPYTPGVELCGETEDGRRVIGGPAGGPGAFAEYALMDAHDAWPVPDSLSDEKAAALYLTYQTGTSACTAARTCSRGSGCSCTPGPAVSARRRSSWAGPPARG